MRKLFVNLFSSGSVSIICLFISLLSCLATQGRRATISDIALRDALEKGRSLIVGEIQGRDKIKESAHTIFYLYRTRVLRCIIVGDLRSSDIQNRVLSLFAGASFGNALIPGKRYIMFIMKDLDYGYIWCHRNDTIDVSGKDGNALIDRFSVKAKEVYKKTDIYKFRHEKTDPNAPLPKLSDQLMIILEMFKTNPEQRNRFAKRIAESELGSRLDPRLSPMSSFVKYLPPKVRLTKGQVIRLFGEPSVKIGRSYFYSCGKVDTPPKNEFRYGVLSIDFDKTSTVAFLGYALLKKEVR